MEADTSKANGVSIASKTNTNEKENMSEQYHIIAKPEEQRCPNLTHTNAKSQPQTFG